MPIVTADNEDGDAVLVLFPKRSSDAPGGWQWEEVEVIHSAIEGFGLCVRQTESLDWARPSAPVHIPLIGRETELQTKEDAEIFAQVLKGNFDDFAFHEIVPPSDGSMWLTDGCFMEESPAGAEPAEGLRVPAPDERVLQISLTTADPAAPCVYMLMAGACELLHIPPAVLAVLRAHQQHHHTDRHFASHVAGFRRAAGSHMLINAHPKFGDSASAAGCINEPTHGTVRAPQWPACACTRCAAARRALARSQRPSGGARARTPRLRARHACSVTLCEMHTRCMHASAFCMHFAERGRYGVMARCMHASTRALAHQLTCSCSLVSTRAATVDGDAGTQAARAPAPPSGRPICVRASPLTAPCPTALPPHLPCGDITARYTHTATPNGSISPTSTPRCSTPSSTL